MSKPKKKKHPLIHIYHHILYIRERMCRRPSEKNVWTHGNETPLIRRFTYLVEEWHSGTFSSAILSYADNGGKSLTTRRTQTN